MSRLDKLKDRIDEIINNGYCLDIIENERLNRINPKEVKTPSPMPDMSFVKDAFLKDLENKLSSTSKYTLSGFINSKLGECEQYRTKVQLAREARTTPQTIHNILSSKVTRPRKDTLIKLAFVLQLSPEDTQSMLGMAGHVFAKCNNRDIILYNLLQESYNDSLVKREPEKWADCYGRMEEELTPYIIDECLTYKNEKPLFGDW